MPAPPLLELRHATLMRGDNRVLDDMTLTLRCGEHTAILGPNGAGKSSLIRLLTLDSYPLAAEDGEAPLLLFGRERWNVAELRARLGIVSPDLHLRFTGGTWSGRVHGLEAVMSGFFASQAVFSHHDVTPAMRRDAAEALSRIGAGHLAAKRLDQMSTGEARRVLIARALVTLPEALVLDEPTTGLDVVARYRFMERIRHIAREGTTIVLVTHHTDEIFPEIGRLVLLHDGRIADDGPTETVLRGEAMARVFGGQLLVEKAGGYFHIRPA